MIPEGATWVRFPRFLGDAAMQLPVLRVLRQAGIGPLVVWGPKATVSLVQDHGLADAVVPDAGKPGPWALAALLRRYKAARSIHFPKSLRPALAAWLARVPERIGVDESGQGLFNTHSGPFWEAEGPFLLRYHTVLRRRWPDLPPMPFADYDPGLQVDRPSGPYLCLMPGSTWPSKAWPREHFLDLARRARREGVAAVVLGVPDEAAICAFVAQEGGLDQCGKTTLKEAAAWLRGAWAAVGKRFGALASRGRLRHPHLGALRSYGSRRFDALGPPDLGPAPRGPALQPLFPAGLHGGRAIPASRTSGPSRSGRNSRG